MRDVVRLRDAHTRSGGTDGHITSTADPDEAVVLVVTLVDATAVGPENLAAKRGSAEVNERAHLQPECAKVARGLAPSASRTASTQHELAFRAWPRLGGVEIALARPGQPPVLLELKCKSGRDALGESVGRRQLAFAMQGGHGVGHLLAGAPAADWDNPVRGAELFTDAEHDIALCRVLYADWWRHWERRDDPQPNELPRSFTTQHLHTAPFALGGSAWQLRLARVEAVGEERLPWPRLTPEPPG